MEAIEAFKCEEQGSNKPARLDKEKGAEAPLSLNCTIVVC